MGYLHRMRFGKREFMKVLFFILTLWSSANYACTDFILKAKDGTWVNGRSLEFAMDLQTKFRVFPRSQRVSSQGPNQKKGISWVSKYGYLGVTGMGMNFSFDGMNEKGLSFGYLWLPGITEYPEGSEKALDFIDLGAWVLGNFSQISEVKEALKQISVWGHPVPPLPGVPPVHATIHDAQGNSLVVEFIKGQMKVHDNPIGILTNSPAFDWHMMNLTNYLQLSPTNAAPLQQNGVMLTPLGQGSGMVGIPGDWTPASRFVRMTTQLRYVSEVVSTLDAVNLAEHLLNTVDIPLGLVRDTKQGSDYTQWAVIKDLSHQVFYFRSYKDLTLKMIDLKKLNFETGSAEGISVNLAKGYVDVTQEFLRASTTCTQR